RADRGARSAPAGGGAQRARRGRRHADAAPLHARPGRGRRAGPSRRGAGRGTPRRVRADRRGARARRSARTLPRDGGSRGVTELRALVRKEFAVLFGSPMAWLTLAAIGLVTALLFFDNLRVYNQILFLYASSTMGGFESDTTPAYVNLRDQVF